MSVILMTTLFYKVGGLGVGVHPQLCTPSRSTPAPSIAVLFVAPELYGKNIPDNTKHNITQKKKHIFSMSWHFATCILWSEKTLIFYSHHTMDH